MLSILTHEIELSVVRLDPRSPVPAWAFFEGQFLSISRSCNELSVVCESRLVPSGLKEENGWWFFEIQGPIPFGLTGVLSAVLGPLAKSNVGIFAVSTYDTDYILVKKADFKAAERSLTAAGHAVFSISSHS